MVWDIEDVLATEETDKGLKIVSKETGDCWIPKIAVSRNSEVKTKGDRGMLCVEPWFALKMKWKPEEKCTSTSRLAPASRTRVASGAGGRRPN
jgi:hypothetical protein